MIKQLVTVHFFALALLIVSCNQDKKDIVGESVIVKPDFTIVQVDANNILLKNTTEGSSLSPTWKVYSVDNKYQQSAAGDNAKFYLGFAGTYNVDLYVSKKGGIDTISKTVSIAGTDSKLCTPILKFLTNCGTEKWRLLQAAGALGVGSSEGDVSGWASSLEDATMYRTCAFNDEMSFTFTANFPFQFDGKGDYYSEDYMGPANWSCQDEKGLEGPQRAWLTNLTNYTFKIEPGDATHPLGFLKLYGKGAHIALPKIQNEGQIGTGPVGTVLTYNIYDTATVAGKKVLTLTINSPSTTWWRIKISTN